MGLQIWLPLDGNINNQGLSDVKIYGAPTSWQEGKIGKCAKFNGDYKIIYTETTHEFDYTDNFSWACWVLPVYSGTAYQYIFSVGRADYGSYGYGARLVSATRINIRYGNVEWGISCEASKWIHIAFVKRDKNIRIYKNGSLYRSITYGGATPTYTESVGLALGCFRYNVGNRYPSFCSINDFRLYNTPLTDRQVREISKGLVCHYPLGEIDGKIGGRNLIKNGKGNVKAGFFKNFPTVTDEYGEFTLKSKKTYKGIILDGFVYECRDYPVGEKYTWSYDIMYTAWNFPTGSNRGELWMGQRYVNAPSGETATGAWRGVTQHNLPVVGQNGCELNKWYHVKQTVTIPQQASSNVGQQGLISFYNSNANVEASFTARLKNVKLEKSSTATPWTPAPEDNTSFYNNIIYDTSGYNNNGSVTDSTCPTWSSDTPRYKGSYAFNGNKQYVNCGASTMIDGQEEITINCWAYMDNWTNFNARLFSCTESGGYNTEGVNSSIKFALNVFTTSDKSKYAYTSTIGGYPGIKLSDMASGWHMITCVYKASVGDAIYLDGKLYEKKTYTSYGIHFNKYSYLFLGGESAGANCIAPYFNGKLSDFRIYATALSDSDILELYQSSASVDNNGNLMVVGEVIEE